MHLVKISIQNYKSLKDVSLSPKQLSVIVGANASGKSNFSDCLDFISETYRHGLEVAISRKGGYENIAFRKMRRSKSPIRISLCIELTQHEIRSLRDRKVRGHGNVRIEHTFSFVARGDSIRAEFEVTQETLILRQQDGDSWKQVIQITRGNREIELDIAPEYSPEDIGIAQRKSGQQSLFDFTDLQFFTNRGYALPSTELLVGYFARFAPFLYSFTQAIEGMRVFQISPTRSREFGVPTPRPELNRFGGNLPAVIDVMRKKNRQEWKSVMQSMRSILPDLESIDVDYTTSRTLGLFFREQGMKRPWSVDEVSDGTIQTLALLVAVFNPESTALIIEEPENSVHPWIIRHIIKACRDASKQKQILITTHSPIVMNSVTPEELWVIWRSEKQSHISEITNIDPDFLQMWKGGSISAFDYLDSGALPEALPPSPSSSLNLEEE